MAAFSISFTSLYSQNITNCEILTALLNNKEIEKVFHFSLHKGKPIIFVDIKQIFKGCQLDSAYGRAVKIVHDSSYIHVIDNSNIIIHSLVKKRSIYRIELYHRIMEAYGHVEFARKSGRYIVSKVLMGNF